MDGRLRQLTAPLLAALALAAPGAAALAAPGAGAEEIPDEPPAALEAAPEPGLALPAPGADAPRETPPGEPARDGDEAASEAPVGPPAPGDAPPAGPGPGDPSADDPPAEPRRGWIDVSHGFVADRLLAPVIRLDRFFSDETELEVERARSFLRWRNEVRFEEAAMAPRYSTSVRANLRFPGVTKALRRLRLVLEGETQDAFTEVFPGEEGAPAGDAQVGTADAELRLGLWDGLLAHADVGAGVLFGLPPGAFGRLRLRWAIPVGSLFLTRIALIGSYRTDDRFGFQTDLHLERPISSIVLARVSSQGRVSEVSPGVEWRSELTAFVALGRRAAGAVGVGVNGATDREPVELETVRVFTRLRRDFYRRWLFFELAPEFFWPYTPARGRHAAWAVTTRLEVQFHGRVREREPDAPEPEDPPASRGAGAATVAPDAASR